MKAKAKIQDVAKLDGYEVDLSAEIATEDGDVVEVFHVAGPGLAVYVRGDDEEAIASLLDTDARAERERQEREGPPLEQPE